MRPSVVVIGGGVAGLAIAFELLERSERLSGGIDVRCLEATDRAGGNIRSSRDKGFLFEWAANGFLDNAPATVTLVRRLGLEDRVVRSSEAAARRFVFRKGKLREVPTTPPAFLGSDVIPLHSKLRLLCEPLIPRRSADLGEESVYDFASRRIGRGAASVLIDAMVSGIYAGDVARLSLESCFPKMRAMESEHGGLFRAMLARRKSGNGSGGGPAGPGGKLTSFRDGLQELTDALAGRLGGRLVFERGVARLSDLGNRGYRIHPLQGAPIDADAVVLACPPAAAGRIAAPMDPELGRAAAGIPSASVAVVHVGFREMALGSKPEGFGFLVPRGQGPRVLGVLWSSNIFSGRAPDGSLLMTAMVGGAHDPDAVKLDDRKLIGIVRDDLARTMDIQAAPYFTRIVRHPVGIPQYEMGHVDRLSVLDRRVREHPGLWLAGNGYRGVSVNACVEEAPEIAESVLEFFNRRKADPFSAGE